MRLQHSAARKDGIVAMRRDDGKLAYSSYHDRFYF
jgi:hypothetical protein